MFYEILTAELEMFPGFISETWSLYCILDSKYSLCLIRAVPEPTKVKSIEQCVFSALHWHVHLAS